MIGDSKQRDKRSEERAEFGAMVAYLYFSQARSWAWARSVPLLFKNKDPLTLLELLLVDPYCLS